MVHVKKMPGDSDDSLIRKFSRKVVDAGIIQQAKQRQFYLKPSQQELRKARRRTM